MKHYFQTFFDPIKRCGHCRNSLEEQNLGVDGAICDECAKVLAPWLFQEVDPYLLALWSIDGYPLVW